MIEYKNSNNKRTSRGDKQLSMVFEPSEIYQGLKVSIQLVIDKSENYLPPVQICHSNGVYNLVKNRLESLDREMLVVILLNTKNHVVGVNEAAIGSIDSCVASPREIVKPALLANAKSIILVHNHPSGDTAPSSQDIDFTSKLKKAADLFGISVLDHIVVGFDSYYSMNDNGVF